MFEQCYYYCLLVDCICGKVGNLCFGEAPKPISLELEYTNAAYGSNYDASYIPAETIAVGNMRALIAIYYFF